jgi:hypothetical protein
MTKANSEGWHFENETKDAEPFVMLENVALAQNEPNTNATSVPTTSELTKDEALAVAWTGIEALAHMGEASIFKSDSQGTVWVQFHKAGYDNANGLVTL